MKPERFARVKELLLRLVDVPAEERSAFLDDACRDDPDLRREVESTLAHDGCAAEILKTQAVLMRELETAPAPGVKVGQTIGHYRIIGFCGEGGMGEVYRAEDTRLKRSVALKFIRRDVVAGPRLRERFIEEARAAAALEHPNICTVHSIEEWDGQLFLVMAFIEGETLKDRIERGPLDLAEILAIAAQAATGLDAAHAAGIIHRDIKSANIMVSRDQRALIVDFGLARTPQERGSGTTHALMGTAAYMSPEQSRGEALDRRTDIWSLGVVMYEMITRQLPFRGESQMAIVGALRAMEPEPCRALRPGTPADLDRIVRKAMAKDADERYPSASELLADVQSLRRRIDPVLRLHQRRLRVVLVLGSAAILVMIGLILRGISRRGMGAPLPNAEPLQVTSGDAWEGEPVLSPDGRRIAYTSDETGVPEVCLIDAQGENPVRLTGPGSPSRQPAWFPDGKDLAYVSEAGGGSSIWKIPASRGGGGSAALLIPRATDPAISPDGARIAFVRPGPTVDMRIWVASIAAPADSVMLTHDGEGTWDHAGPAWSPDGKSICYAASRGLWIVPAAGGAAKPLARDEPDQEPVWDHDGRYVYFASYREGTLAIWRIAADGGHPQRLTIGTGPESHPSVSQDGVMLAYTTGITGREMLLLDRGTKRQVRVPGVRNSGMAAIAPDGSSLVYQAERRAGRYDLWIQPLQAGSPSGDPRPLTDQVGLPSHPAYSPDGRWIAYYLIADGQRDIWVTQVAGGEPMRITDDPGQDQQPAWAPDGKSLAFITERAGHSRIVIVGIDEGRPVGAPVEIPMGDIDAFHPTWLADGRMIAFAGKRGDDVEAWVVRSDGSKPPYRITTGASITVVRWDPIERRLLASGLWGGSTTWGSTMTIRSVSLETGDVTPLSPEVDFGSAHSAGMFDISQDGRWIVYPREEDRGDVWVLEATKGEY